MIYDMSLTVSSGVSLFFSIASLCVILKYRWSMAKIETIMLFLILPCFLSFSPSFANDTKIYDKGWSLDYRIDNDGRIYDKDWNLKGRIEKDRVYDKDWNLRYRIDGDRVYDRNWNLKYRINGDKIYDKNWNLKGRIQKR